MRSILLTVSICTALLAGSCVTAIAEPVAQAGKRTITRAELEKELSGQIFELENTRYEMFRDGLNAMIAKSLMEQEAAERGVTVEVLYKAEITDKTAQPTEEEIKILYDANKEELGVPLEDARERLVAYLTNVRFNEARQVFIERLKEKYPTSIALRPPTIEVGQGSLPSRGGGANAAVTIVEFSDYECPYCKRAEPTVDKVVETYGDKVRVFYRDSPLPFHADAKPAAAASRCANAQGKFWEYHQKLMASEELTPEAFKSLADAVGLERAKFDECLTKNDFADAIQKDMDDGAAAGVNGTPAFFINGRMIDGARPFEQFKEIIDEELAKTTKPG
jgi:protein-disulfide isomerase